VLAIETGGMFQRLNNHRFWETARCIIVEMGAGFRPAPPGALFAFFPTTRICRSTASSIATRTALQISTARSSRAMRRARFLGVTPQDIVDFGLEDATHPLAATDIKRAQDALQNDPFIMAHPEWIAAIKQLLYMGVRAEQQALAKWGLSYVIRRLFEVSVEIP
jgi:DNA topoisomerase-6 subunit A